MSEIIQRSEEWFQERLGKVTASRLHDLLATTKSGPAASRKNYTAELVVERLTSKQAERFTSKTMEWGTEQEPFARAEYEAREFVNIHEVGFIHHPSISMAGASPDGLIGTDGLIEIKCPNTATHLETLLNQTIDAKYIAQVQWQMACTGRQWCDFISFDPSLPENISMFCKRIPRDQKFIMIAEAEVVKFLAELDRMVERLRAM